MSETEQIVTINKAQIIKYLGKMSNEHMERIYESIRVSLHLNPEDPLPISAVQGDSGHTQAQMVTDQYSHILDDDRKNNAALFEDAFYSGKSAETVSSEADAPANAGSEQTEATADGVDPELI